MRHSATANALAALWPLPNKDSVTVLSGKVSHSVERAVMLAQRLVELDTEKVAFASLARDPTQLAPPMAPPAHSASRVCAVDGDEITTIVSSRQPTPSRAIGRGLSKKKMLHGNRQADLALRALLCPPFDRRFQKTKKTKNMTKYYLRQNVG